MRSVPRRVFRRKSSRVSGSTIETVLPARGRGFPPPNLRYHLEGSGSERAGAIRFPPTRRHEAENTLKAYRISSAQVEAILIQYLRAWDLRGEA